MDLDLTTLSSEDLHQLLDAVRQEIARRSADSTTPVVWTHACQDQSRHHLQKYKHWAKRLTGVDINKTGGYAWEGEFLAVGREHVVPPGSYIVSVCDEEITAYVVGAEGVEPIGQANTRKQHALIVRVADLMQK